MKVDNDFNLELLLHEDESATLDFKQKNYRLSNRNDYQKSEIIKDILAFANGWRRGTAYILLGVKEVQGGRSQPIGLDEDIDDAALQELVNSKTQKHVKFSYTVHSIDGVKVGVISIPVQKRPIFVVKQFGKLKQNEVPMRIGSSTKIATPDDIADMVKAEVIETKELVDIKFEFVDRENENVIGNHIEIRPVVIDMSQSNEIGDFVGSDNNLPSDIAMTLSMLGLFQKKPIRDYYRDLASYKYEVGRTKKLSFLITNSSGMPINDVNVELSVDATDNRYSLRTIDSITQKPKSHTDPIHEKLYVPPVIMSGVHTLSNKLELYEMKNEYKVNVAFPKVQPKQSICCTNDIYISAVADFDAKIHVKIFADELSEPITRELEVSCIVENKKQRLLGMGQQVVDGLVLSDLNIKVKK